MKYLLLLALAGCSIQRDDSDPPGGNSKMLGLTDNLTGCQYLQSNSLTPRMKADGKQVCKETP